MFPCAGNKWIFQDTTPDVIDTNQYLTVTDTAYNLFNGKYETTRLFLSPLYEGIPVAVFSVGTPKYYINPLTDSKTLDVDSSYKKFPLGADLDCQRQFYVAIIGGDFSEYMVIALVNSYENVFFGSEENIVWAFTREQYPKPCTYKKIYEDLLKSGFNPCHLVSIEQSINVQTLEDYSDSVDVVSSNVQTKSIKKKHRDINQDFM
jgi:hypothetical protein